MSPRRSPAGGARRRGGGRPAPALCDRTTCPNKRSHDTYSAARSGCRSPAARADTARYSKLRRNGIYPHARVPVGPTARRLRCLTAIGWSLDALAEQSGMSRAQLGNLREGTRYATCTQITAARVDALFGRLWMTWGPSQYTRDLALGRDWYPAGAYDDIDNMAEKPKPGRPVTGFERGDATARRTEIARRHSTGQKAPGIARDMGLTVRSVERHLAALAAATTEAVAS